jgi:hypothetical protein
LKEGTNSLLRCDGGEQKIFQMINLEIFMSLKLIDGTDMQTWKILFSFKTPPIGRTRRKKGCLITGFRNPSSRGEKVLYRKRLFDKIGCKNPPIGGEDTRKDFGYGVFLATSSRLNCLSHAPYLRIGIR